MMKTPQKQPDRGPREKLEGMLADIFGSHGCPSCGGALDRGTGIIERCQICGKKDWSAFRHIFLCGLGWLAAVAFAIFAVFLFDVSRRG